MKLQGKTAIITGASSGLGREFARQLTDIFPEIECCWLIARREDRLEEIAGKILKLVEEDPAKKNQAATFLNYYLPTTEKLLDSYADFEEAGVSGENLTQAKEKIRRTMDSIMAGFERQLDALYHADAMDVDSDIRVMETMLRRDGGSVEEDFGLGGTAVATQEDL